MQDIIHLLSDAVANQIAAGEVVQRPASVVKELMENAIDAGASHIQLIIKDVGKTLVQVVDNGKGMSFSDARLCFERHATSKITSSKDLFSLTTKGFRGEALASIAAIAQVELKTKPADDAVGTCVIIEGSEIKEHLPATTQKGTSIAVKNIFFNVPARRNFLKSDVVEFGHVEEEFFRIALINNDISFSFYHNGKLIHQLNASNFKQRIINLMGNHFKEKLFPIEQKIDAINISGFIAKPENAKKKKSEQYLFINDRFVKHFALTHAVETAYSDLIPEGYKPAFFIKIEVDPATIDVNISPTKVEVKLQDERLVYGFLNAAVKKAIGTLTLTPQIDFDCEPGLDVSQFKENHFINPPTVKLNPNYNPFSHSQASVDKHKYDDNFNSWDKFLTDIKKETVDVEPNSQAEPQIPLNFQDNNPEQDFWESSDFQSFCFSNRYLIFKNDQNLAVVDIVYARERILYENYLAAMDNTPVAIQQLLFPETITLSASACELLRELKPEMHDLGYELESIDSTSFAVNGVPSDCSDEDVQHTIEDLLSSYQSYQFLQKSDRHKNIAACMSKQKRSNYKPLVDDIEQKEFLKNLFASSMPSTSPSGKKIIHLFTVSAIAQLF